MIGIKDYSVADFFIESKSRFFFLLKNWVFLFGAALFGSCIGLLKFYMTVDEYVASVTFFNENVAIPKQAPLIPSLLSQGSTIIQDNQNIAYIGDNILGIFLSPSLVKKTLLDTVDYGGRHPLVMFYINNHYKKYKDARLMNYALMNSDRPVDSVLDLISSEMLRKDIRLDFKEKKLSFITLEVQDVNEFFAKTFMDRLTMNVIASYKDYRTSKAQAQVLLLQENVDSLKQVIYRGLNNVATISDNNLSPSKQRPQITKLQSQSEIQAASALYTELNRQLLFAKINLEKERPVLQIVNYSSFPLEKKRIVPLTAISVYAFIALFITCTYLFVRKQMQEAIYNR